MSEKLVTIARYTDNIEASLAKQLLEDNNIKVVLMGENVASVYAGVPAVIDIELQTLESQAQEARSILESQEEKEFLD